MLGRQNVIISLSESRLDIYVHANGHVLRSESVSIDPDVYLAAWAKGLNPLDGTLRQMLSKVRVRGGALATLIYNGPQMVCDVINVPAKGSDAHQAALLSLSEAVPYSTDGNPTCAVTLAVDTSGQSHVLAVVDRDETAHAACSWLRHAGLKVKELVPAVGIAMAHAAERALAAGSDGVSTHALVLIGDNRTVVAAAIGGDLRIVRHFDLGIDVLADAYLRAAQGTQVGPARMSHQQARELLFKHGVPRGRDEVIDEQLGLTPANVLPFMQPAIQRLMVEIKQTLRYAIGDQELLRANIAIAGHGATTPNLAQSLSYLLDLPIGEAKVPSNSGFGAPADSDADLFWRCRTSGISILPMAERQVINVRSGGRVVLAGAAAVAVVIASDAVVTLGQIRAVNRELESIQPDLARVRQDLEQRRIATELAEAVNTQAAAVARAVGERVEWRTLISELARAVTPEVRLTEIAAEQSDSGAVLSLRGIVNVPEQAPARTRSEPGAGEPSGGAVSNSALTDFVKRLAGSPAFEGVDIAGVRNGELAHSQVEIFSVNARLRTLPARLTSNAALADAGKPGEPTP